MFESAVSARLTHSSVPITSSSIQELELDANMFDNNGSFNSTNETRFIPEHANGSSVHHADGESAIGTLPKTTKIEDSDALSKTMIGSSSRVASFNFVDQRRPLDVLMGRGSRSNNNEGNRRFLQAKEKDAAEIQKRPMKKKKNGQMHIKSG